MDKTYKVAVIVGDPKINDMSDNATELATRICMIRDSGRFDRMLIMPADKAPRIAATAHFQAADVIVCVSAGARRSCRTAAKRVALPMLCWDAGVKRLVNDDEDRDVPTVGDALTVRQVRRLNDGECVVCDARDEYDSDIGNGYWSCMACQSEFEIEEGPRGRIKSAVRRELTSATMDVAVKGWEETNGQHRDEQV